MKTYASREAKNNFGEFLEEGQRQPVQVTRNGRRIGGFLSQDLFDDAVARERKKAQLDILGAINKLATANEGKPNIPLNEYMELLECDEEEAYAIMGEEYFKS